MSHMGVDIGTSGCKAVVFRSDRGHSLRAPTVNTPFDIRKPAGSNSMRKIVPAMLAGQVIAEAAGVRYSRSRALIGNFQSGRGLRAC